MTAPELLTHQQDGIRWLTLNRPERRNALTPGLIAALDAQAADLEVDDSVRVVVVRGAGASFCAGGDFTAFLEAPEDEGPVRFLSDLTDCFARIEQSSKTWIAVLHGHAIAGGLELALVCDVVLAAHDTLIGDGHVNNRLLPAGGSAVRLERAVGKGLARWMHLSGDLLSVAELLQTGWIREVADRDSLDDMAHRVASRLASIDGGVQQRMKRLVAQVAEASPEAGLAQELRAFEENWTAADVPAALRSFLAGRSARTVERREEVA